MNPAKLARALIRDQLFMAERLITTTREKITDVLSSLPNQLVNTENLVLETTVPLAFAFLAWAIFLRNRPAQK